MLGGIGSVTVSPFEVTTDGGHVFPMAVLEVDRSESTAIVEYCMDDRVVVVKVAESLLPLR